MFWQAFFYLFWRLSAFSISLTSRQARA